MTLRRSSIKLLAGETCAAVGIMAFIGAAIFAFVALADIPDCASCAQKFPAILPAGRTARAVAPQRPGPRLFAPDQIAGLMARLEQQQDTP